MELVIKLEEKLSILLKKHHEQKILIDRLQKQEHRKNDEIEELKSKIKTLEKIAELKAIVISARSFNSQQRILLEKSINHVIQKIEALIATL